MNAFEKAYKELKKRYIGRPSARYAEYSAYYDLPKGQWGLWRKRPKTEKEKEEVVVGAILTQRTNWKNVEMALKNLKQAGVLSVNKIYRLGKENPRALEKLIKPSGFYRQKAKRLFYLCRFIVEKQGSLERFFNQTSESCREQLLKIYGVGPETADSILLYAGQKPVFVIDEYTRRFVKKRGISKNFSYYCLQDLFQKNLPKDIKIYQDFHALIVLEGKENN